jgi:hypothetical protein
MFKIIDCNQSRVIATCEDMADALLVAAGCRNMNNNRYEIHRDNVMLYALPSR